MGLARAALNRHPRPPCTLQAQQSNIAPALIAAHVCERAQLLKGAALRSYFSVALKTSLRLGARSRSGCGPAPRHVGVTTASVAVDPSPLVSVRVPVWGPMTATGIGREGGLL